MKKFNSKNKKVILLKNKFKLIVLLTLISTITSITPITPSEWGIDKWYMDDIVILQLNL